MFSDILRWLLLAGRIPSDIARSEAVSTECHMRGGLLDDLYTACCNLEDDRKLSESKKPRLKSRDVERLQDTCLLRP